MNKSKKRYLLRNLPITKRLLILMLTVSVIPLLAIGSSSYINSKNSIIQLSNTYDQKLIDTFCLCIDLITKKYLEVSDELVMDSVIQDTLKNYDNLDSSEKFNANRSIDQKTSSKFTRFSDLETIRIVTTSNTPILSSGYHFNYNNEMNTIIYERIRASDSPYLWLFSKCNNESFLVLARKVKTYSFSTDIGYIIMYIHPSALISFFSDFDSDNQLSITLVDSYNEILSLSEDTPVFSDENIHYILSQPQTKNSLIQDISNTQSYSVHYTHLDFVDWNLISSIPESTLFAPLKSIKTAVSFMVIISILFSATLTWYTIQSISKPLYDMIQKIERLSELNFKSHSSQRANDELGFLSDAYALIFDKIQSLTAQIKQEQEEKRNAEIKMLQAQINPHFLFNTLDSLKFTALLSNAPTVSQGLTALSHILRNSIIDKTGFITISEEVKNIEDYLIIQKIRYGETITLHKHITDETCNCLIMKFLLQPIVENSIIHGLTGNQCIDINLTVERVQDKVIIILSDNGKGFDVGSQYDQKTKRFKSSKLSGIGLENIRERLELEYGNEQCFSITSKKNEGTSILITFPFKT